MLILTQFVFRLSFGLAIAMAATPARLVTSGFFRVHLLVIMGLNTLACLAIYSGGSAFPHRLAVFSLAATAAASSFVGSVVWLYEQRRWGKGWLTAIALISLAGAAFSTDLPVRSPPTALLLALLDIISSGLLLGVTLAAMLLGHWYLNTPTMELLPLRKLIILMAVTILARAVICGVGLSMHLAEAGALDRELWIFLSLRWLSGLIGTMILAGLTWLTLRIPNTQSATGILYAGVVLTFIGELTSRLLSVGEFYPL